MSWPDRIKTGKAIGSLQSVSRGVDAYIYK